MAELLTVEQGAKQLNIDDETIRRAIRVGELEAYKLGKGYRFTQRALDTWVEKQKVQVVKK